LWHLTEVLAACQPRCEPGMPRNAATRSCSTMISSPVAESSACAGDVVPQNGQTSSFLAGFHCASPPHDGQETFFWAVESVIRLSQRNEPNMGRGMLDKGMKKLFNISLPVIPLPLFP